jgi:hypothetical protein
VQDAGAFGEEAEDLPVAALDLRRGAVGGVEFGVDVGEELGQFAGAGPGGQDALLVVAELFPDQVEVAFALVLVDLGEELVCRTEIGSWP